MRLCLWCVHKTVHVFKKKINTYCRYDKDEDDDDEVSVSRLFSRIIALQPIKKKLTRIEHTQKKEKQIDDNGIVL